MKPIELEQLAVMFRVNDPNLGHVSTLETMTEAGMAYAYGLYRSIPKHHWRRRNKFANYIADQLDQKAKFIRGESAALAGKPLAAF